MSKHVLVLYSTTDGHTLKICQHIQSVLEAGLATVKLAKVSDSVDLKNFDLVVVGASIRYGKHKAEVVEFLTSHRQQLEQGSCAFFTVNLVARKENKNTPETNPYYQKLVSELGWQPKAAAVFAGKINYPAYRFLDRIMIQLIMWITKGPTHPQTVKEFTDWQAVECFAAQLLKL